MARKGFSFYKSFDDVYNSLNDKQKLSYMDNLLDVQFLRKKINDVYFEDSILTLLWTAQKHSIESGINGYLDSQKSSRIKNPFFGCYKNLPPTDPQGGGTQTPKEEEEEKEEEKEQLIINEDKAEKVFLKFRENYKEFANSIYLDKITRDSLKDTFFKTANTDEILNLTLKHYLSLFLKHLDLTKELHQTKKSFINHFPNWLRKQQSLGIIKPKQKPMRYV